MNINYVGSVAERFMKFRSTLNTEEDISYNLFNAISIYVPKSLATANLAEGSYDADSITADAYAVITVTVDNYTDVFSSTSNLLTQWKPVFNDDTNVDLTMYIVIFDDTGFQPTLAQKSIAWAPLTKAFNELYFISFFKTMFSNAYTGSEDDSDSNFFDLSLCLAYLCENEATLSFCLSEVHLTLFEDGEDDPNACNVLSLEEGTEETYCTTLVGTDQATRAKYYWGYLKLIASTRTSFIIHNGTFVTPIVLGLWFSATNSTGQYIGNKLDKIRLTNAAIKPTGLPSPLNSAVNKNLDEVFYTILDAKNVGYLLSIADNSVNNAELIREEALNQMPVTAYMIAKYIDYTTSQDMAKYATAIATSTKPVLANETTYKELQKFLSANISKFSTLGRLENVNIAFPPYSEAKQGNWFKGIAVWSANYISDLEGVQVTGSITF